MKILKTNFAQDSITTISSSSQKTTFPAENIRNEFRAKEWRSSGHFVLTASNNSIDLNEGSGFSSTTVPAGAYTPETLATAVKSALDTLGSNTYTVTFSRVTGLWTIASTGNFDLDGTFKDVIGLTQDLSGSASTYTGAAIAIHTEESVVFDLRTIEDVDTVALLWEKGLYKLSDSAVLTVEANATNVWTSPAFSQSLVFDDLNEIAQAHFPTESYRFWRIKIVDPQNVNLYVNLGVVVLGLSDQILTSTSNGFSFSVRDMSRVQQTDFGQRYTDIFPKIRSLNLKFDVMELSEVEAILNFFETVGVSQTIFVHLDPAEAIFTNGQFQLYGKLDSDVSINHQVTDVFNSGLSITETN